MSSIYQKAIHHLSIYLEIPTVKQSVTRAIRNLEKQEAEVRIENQIGCYAPEILKKLLEENEKKKLEEIEKIRIITHEFLLQQKFDEQRIVHLYENTYSLKGYEDVVYIFELIFIPERHTVALQRLKNGNRPSRGGIYTFDEIPNLAIGEWKKDERILKNNLKGLRLELKRCWEHLNVDKTPSVSEDRSAEDLSDWLSSAS